MTFPNIWCQTLTDVTAAMAASDVVGATFLVENEGTGRN